MTWLWIRLDALGEAWRAFRQTYASTRDRLTFQHARSAAQRNCKHDWREDRSVPYSGIGKPLSVWRCRLCEEFEWRLIEPAPSGAQGEGGAS